MPASVRLAGSTPPLPFVPSPPPPLILGTRAPPLVPTTATSTTSARPRRIQPAPVVARSSSPPPPHLRSPCAPPPPHRSALHCLGASVPVSSDGGHACQLLGFLFLAFPPPPSVLVSRINREVEYNTCHMKVLVVVAVSKAYDNHRSIVSGD